MARPFLNPMLCIIAIHEMNFRKVAESEAAFIKRGHRTPGGLTHDKNGGSACAVGADDEALLDIGCLGGAC